MDETGTQASSELPLPRRRGILSRIWRGLSHPWCQQRTIRELRAANKELQTQVREAEVEVERRTRIEISLRELAKSLPLETGQPFYEALVTSLTKALDVDFGLISLLDSSTQKTATTLAVCDQGCIVDNFSYELDGTPCSYVVHRNVCIYPENVARLFPRDPVLSDKGFECYAGIPLRDHDDNVFGLLAIMDRRPLGNSEFVESLMAIFASRAGGEIVRSRTQQALQDSEHRYRSLLAASSSVVWTSDAQGSFIAEQESWTNYTGQLSQLQRGYGWMQMVHIADRAQFRQAWSQSKPENTFFQCECRLWNSATHSFRHNEFRAAQIRGSDDTIREWIGTFTDVEERRQASDRFNSFFDLSLDLMCISTGRGKLVAVNPAFESVLGFSRQEFLNRSFYEFVHPDDRRETSRASSQLLSGLEALIDFENRVRCKDGSYRWLQWRCREVSDHGLIYAVARDVTDQKRHAAIIEQTHRVAQVGGWELDLIRNDLYWTAETYHLHELKPTEFTPTVDSVLKFYTPQSELLVRNAIEKAISDGQSFDLELQLTTAHGRRLWVRAVGLVELDGGRPVKLFGSFQNITQQRQAEKAVRDSQERFRRYFELGLVGMAISSPVKQWIEVNEQLCEMFGYSRAELQQKTWADITAPEDLASNIEIFERMLAGEIDGYELQKRFVRKNGSLIHTMISVRCLRCPDGSVDYFLLIVQDITTQVLVEREREALISDLERKNAELERFTYTVSHDLKSPLFTISGFLGLLQEDAAEGNTEQLQHDITRIMDATNRMKQLLDELLQLSRIGRIVGPQEDVDLNEVIEQILLMVGNSITEQGVEVVVAPDLPSVMGDRTRIYEVFQNLLENALRFFGSQAEPKLEIGYRMQDGDCVYWVRDNGIGILPEYHKMVFELFERLETGTDGTGIGLALVKRIVECHGGKIWVESDGLGCGSTFYLTLTRPVGTDAETEEAVHNLHTPTRTLRIHPRLNADGTPGTESTTVAASDSGSHSCSVEP